MHIKVCTSFYDSKDRINLEAFNEEINSDEFHEEVTGFSSVFLERSSLKIKRDSMKLHLVTNPFLYDVIFKKNEAVIEAHHTQKSHYLTSGFIRQYRLTLKVNDVTYFEYYSNRMTEATTHSPSGNYARAMHKKDTDKILSCLGTAIKMGLAASLSAQNPVDLKPGSDLSSESLKVHLPQGNIIPQKADSEAHLSSPMKTAILSAQASCKIIQRFFFAAIKKLPANVSELASIEFNELKELRG